VGEVSVKLTVNGQAREATAEPRMTLADFLREKLRLTGTHLGCEHGVCGACTVLCDGLPVRSCLMFAVQADGASLETVEGLATPTPTPNPLPPQGAGASGGEPSPSSSPFPLAVGRGAGPRQGLTGMGVLHPLQQAFHEAHALQCGYCTPGMLMSALYLLERQPRPSREQIKRAIAGNLCRCTGYEFIVEAIALAAERLAAGEAHPAAGETPERPE